jgi:hypothetical protein
MRALSIMTLSIIMLRIITLSITLSITALGIIT